MMTNTTTPTATPNAILRGCSMDYTMQIEWAMRADGQWFKRLQYRDQRYGYKWSAWTTSVAPYTFTSPTGCNARLPKEAR
jgi:hypothetical protein